MKLIINTDGAARGNPGPAAAAFVIKSSAGNLQEICGKYLHKGSKIYLEGRLQTSSWDDQSGNKRYRTEVIADNMIMLDRKSDSAPRQEGQTYREEPPYSAPAQTMPQENQSSEEEISVEDIPF